MKSTISHVELQQGDVHILILGGGNGGNALIKLFNAYRDWLYIDGIIDINSNAIGMQYAQELGIPVFLDAAEAIASFAGDIIIDVTANPDLRHIFVEAKAQHQDLEVISGKSSRLLFDLVNQGQKQRQTIKDKNLHLNLLNAMLDISLKLEGHKNTSDVIKHASQGLHHGLQAKETLVIMLKGMAGNQCFGILDKPIPTSVPDDFIQYLQEYFVCQDHTGKAFVLLTPALYVPFIDETFNLAIPLLDSRGLIAVLLVKHDKPLDINTRMLLEVTSSHLHLAIKTKQHAQEIEYQAIRDPLTGIYNRRYFSSRINEEFNRLQRGQQGSLSCMFFDVDFFKPINDQYGHKLGDLLLIRIAEHIRHHLRAYDVVARYGGDEFIALLPGEIGKTLPLKNIACRILDSVKNINIKGYEHINISLSIGVASISSCTLQTSQELVSLADEALYHAKSDGRGCIRLKEALEHTYINKTSVRGTRNIPVNQPLR